MKLYKYLFGPEIVWMSSYIIAKYIGKINTTGRLNDFIDMSSFAAPLVVFMIIRLLFHNQIADIPFFRIRLILSALILGHFFASAWAEAYIPQGPGTGMIYLIIAGEAILLSLIYVVILSLKKV
jgi:hypothetical protein